MANETLSLSSYRILGRSGLRVSPLSLGTMTFGPDWGWGTDYDESRRIFEMYVDFGGNFIDTANYYTNGSSELFIGAFAAGMRDRLVIATKYTLPIRAGDPNSCGNHRKSMAQSVETSLRNLKTDYIDLLYLHYWDATTPVEEILRAMDDLVRAGKVLYVGISDTMAWQIARMQAIADLRGWSPLIALQVEYNLIERTAERELIPMAREMGLGVIPWSPLAGGILVGKYTRADLLSFPAETYPENSRKSYARECGQLTERSFEIVDVVNNVAIEIGARPSQVALAWILLNPGVTSPIIGARTLSQLCENLGALEIRFTDSHLASLEKASAIGLGFPHDLLARLVTASSIFGGQESHVKGNSGKEKPHR